MKCGLNEREISHICAGVSSVVLGSVRMVNLRTLRGFSLRSVVSLGVLFAVHAILGFALHLHVNVASAWFVRVLLGGSCLPGGQVLRAAFLRGWRWVEVCGAGGGSCVGRRSCDKIHDQAERRVR